MKRWLALLILAAMMVAYAGRDVPAAPPQVVKIGILFPLTGPVAATGVASVNAIKLAVEIINDKYPDLKLPLAATSGLPNLGGAKVELVIADHQMNPELGASETERLITQQGVVAIIGAYASAITETASASAERLGIPFLNDQSTSPRLHRRGFKWFFRTTPHDEVFSDLMLRFLKELNEKRNLGIKSVATIYENTLFGTDSSRTQNNFAKIYGFQVVANVRYPNQTSDLTSEIQSLKAANPDVVLPTSYISDAILMVRTMKTLDYAPRGIMAQGVGFTEGSFLPTVGRDGNFILSREVFADDLRKSKPLVGQVADLFKKRYNADLEGATARSFTAMIVLADAINRAGSTNPNAIRQALLATNVPAEQLIVPWKGVKFDQRTGQNVLGDGIIVQAFDGKYQTVWPFNLASREIAWPFPSWSRR